MPASWLCSKKTMNALAFVGEDEAWVCSEEWRALLSWLRATPNCRQAPLDIYIPRLATLPFDTFLAQQDLAILVELPASPTSSSHLREVLFRQMPEKCLCAISVAKDYGEAHAQEMYELSLAQGADCLGLLESAMRCIGDGTDGSGSVHIFAAPAARCKTKPDKFWHQRFVKGSQRHGEERAYSAYRNTIDELICQAMQAVVVGQMVQGAVVVAELCGGDGSLARKLLQHDEIEIEAYHLIERNEMLLETARKHMDDRLRIWHLDVCTVGSSEVLMEVERVDFWIASGSTLCGQVGDARFAEQTLRAMALSLKAGGHMIITGFTNNFLTPRMITLAGLKVVRASVPSAEADGLGKAFGRLVFFVLQKELTETIGQGVRGEGDVRILRRALYDTS